MRGGAEEDIEHVEHAPKGVLDVFDVTGGEKQAEHQERALGVRREGG